MRGTYLRVINKKIGEGIIEKKNGLGTESSETQGVEERGSQLWKMRPGQRSKRRCRIILVNRTQRRTFLGRIFTNS